MRDKELEGDVAPVDNEDDFSVESVDERDDDDDDEALFIDRYFLDDRNDDDCGGDSFADIILVIAIAVKSLIDYSVSQLQTRLRESGLKFSGCAKITRWYHVKIGRC